MDFDDNVTAASGTAGPYASLSDAQVRSAIRFAEVHLRSVQDDYDTVRRLYRQEIDIMRGHLIDRLLARIITRAKPISDEQHHELLRRFERQATPPATVVSLVRAASRGRTDHVEALSEIEAMAILLLLGVPR